MTSPENLPENNLSTVFSGEEFAELATVRDEFLNDGYVKDMARVVTADVVKLLDQNHAGGNGSKWAVFNLGLIEDDEGVTVDTDVLVMCSPMFSDSDTTVLRSPVVRLIRNEAYRFEDKKQFLTTDISVQSDLTSRYFVSAYTPQHSARNDSQPEAEESGLEQRVETKPSTASVFLVSPDGNLYFNISFTEGSVTQWHVQSKTNSETVVPFGYDDVDGNLDALYQARLLLSSIANTPAFVVSRMHQ